MGQSKDKLWCLGSERARIFSLNSILVFSPEVSKVSFRTGLQSVDKGCEGLSEGLVFLCKRELVIPSSCQESRVQLRVTWELSCVYADVNHKFGH